MEPRGNEFYTGHLRDMREVPQGSKVLYGNTLRCSAFFYVLPWHTVEISAVCKELPPLLMDSSMLIHYTNGFVLKTPILSLYTKSLVKQIYARLFFDRNGIIGNL